MESKPFNSTQFAAAPGVKQQRRRTALSSAGVPYGSLSLFRNANATAAGAVGIGALPLLFRGRTSRRKAFD